MTAIMEICRDDVDVSWKQLSHEVTRLDETQFKGGTPRPLDAAEHVLVVLQAVKLHKTVAFGYL